MGIFSKSAPEEDDSLVETPDPFETLLRQPAVTGTVVAKGMSLTGSLKGEGDVLIEGKLSGEVETVGTVTVSSTGELEGPITADDVKVAGRVKGNITARGQLRLECMGSVDGDISSASLIVENGSSFNGRSTMLPPAEGKQTKQPAAPQKDGETEDGQDKY